MTDSDSIEYSMQRKISDLQAENAELRAEVERLTKLLHDISQVSQSRVVRTMIEQNLKPTESNDE